MCWVGLDFIFCVFVLPFMCFLCANSGDFVPMLLAFVVMGLVTLLPSQEIIWEG